MNLKVRTVRYGDRSILVEMAQNLERLGVRRINTAVTLFPTLDRPWVAFSAVGLMVLAFLFTKS
jgi:hypothetical protein